MNIKTDRAKILPTLSLVSSVVEKRQTLPMLSNLYFSLDDGTLRVIGTDLEVEISEAITEVEGENGLFTVSTQKILDIARMLPEKAAISIKQEDDNVVVTSSRSRYKLKTLPAEEFPRIETGNWEERFKIDQLSLKSLLNKTAFAMAVQDVRYYLNGILFELSKKQLRAIATDGHRLARSEVDIDLDLKETRELIVPRKAINEITRFISDDEETELIIEMSRNHLKLSRNETVLITKLIDGKFPEFKGVLETEPDITISVDRVAFIDTLNRVAVLTATTDRFRGVKVNLEEGIMRVTAKNQEQEEAVEEIAVEYSGDPVEFGYNVGYLIDAARAGEGETLELHLQRNDGICIIKQPGDERTTWLVMPMRI